MARGSTYTEEEDFSICRAYVSVTTDPIVGAEQKGGNFWTRIFEVFKAKHQEHYPDKPYHVSRTRESIMSRWKRPISIDCKEMDHLRKSTEKPSGFNELQYRDLLSSKFAELHNNKRFVFWKQLEYLQEALPPLFAQGLSPVDALPPEVVGLLSSVASQIDNESGTAMDTVKVGHVARPIGTKRAKKLAEEERMRSAKEGSGGGGGGGSDESNKRPKITPPEVNNGNGNGFALNLAETVSNAIDRIGAKVASKANGAVYLTMAKLALDLNKREEAEHYFALAQQQFALPPVRLSMLSSFPYEGSSCLTSFFFFLSSICAPVGEHY